MLGTPASDVAHPFFLEYSWRTLCLLVLSSFLSFILFSCVFCVYVYFGKLVHLVCRCTARKQNIAAGWALLSQHDTRSLLVGVFCAIQAKANITDMS